MLGGNKTGASHQNSKLLIDKQHFLALAFVVLVVGRCARVCALWEG